jgi:4-amino-4-deoxy-L-arabinose transferase-like glycosyltransferase
MLDKAVMAPFSRLRIRLLEDKNLSRKAGASLVGAGVALFTLVLYLRTLAPTVLPIEFPYLADSPMLQMQACVLGIPHPTGYPTYLMLTHLFTYLPVGDCAYRVNLASAAYASVAVLLVFFAGLSLSRRVVAAVAAALAFGIGSTLWSQAVIAEVYTLNALFVALALVVLLVWRERRRDRYLLLAAFCVGLSMTDHMTAGLLLPATLLFIAIVEWRKLTDVSLVLEGGGLFLLGLTPYLYLPIRAYMDPPFRNNNPTSFERFWWLISGGDLRGSFCKFGPAELPGRIVLYVHNLTSNFSWWLLAAGMVGLVATLLRDRAVALLLGFLFSGWLLFAVEDNIPDVAVYFIPTYLVLSLWIAVGIGFALEEAEPLISKWRQVPKTVALGALSVALVLLPLVGVGKTYARNDMSRDYQGQEIIDEVAKSAAPNATILHHRSELWYMVLVERRRRDLTLVDPFSHDTKIRYANIVWPDDDIDLKTMNRRYGTNDLTGVSAAKKAATKGPVYVLAQEGIDLRSFRDAGFKTVGVRGALFELIPRDH